MQAHLKQRWKRGDKVKEHGIRRVLFKNFEDLTAEAKSIKHMAYRNLNDANFIARQKLECAWVCRLFSI
ncbi:MAG: hypothetical protein APF77_00925 [Clostridia bacterium BRH_c25]|nr:MAG: hypothetical protein APF77_00925 [Clostridia bacterium BRH_c25]